MIPVPLAGDVTITDPVANEQVGCVVNTAGAVCKAGCVFTTILVLAIEVHPAALSTVKT